MKQLKQVTHQFLERSKFACLAFNNVYVDLAHSTFQLIDGTWVLPGVPVSDLGIWKEWIGTLRMNHLEKANLVFFIEEPAVNPGILDDVALRLQKNLDLLFSLMHLRGGIEYDSAILLYGYTEQGVPTIRQMSELPRFYPSKGYQRAPVTQEWIEDALVLREGAVATEVDEPEYRRIRRGLSTLLNALRETGQNRLHQFVRSLEALILPETGRTKDQFTHRCQTFARANAPTRLLLQEAFDMRSNTEHLHEWDKAVQGYPEEQREDVCWLRTRQIEKLACYAYSKVLRDATLREYFRADSAIEAFWNLRDGKKRQIWGEPLDIATEPLIQKYDQFHRAAI